MARRRLTQVEPGALPLPDQLEVARVALAAAAALAVGRRDLALQAVSGSDPGPQSARGTGPSKTASCAAALRSESITLRVTSPASVTVAIVTTTIQSVLRIASLPALACAAS